MTISEQQRATLKEPPVKGPVWVSQFTVPPPQEDRVRTLLLRVIDELDAGNGPYTQPQSAPIDAQWTGHRESVDKDAPEPPMSEDEKYTMLMKEVSSPVVIMFVYGGAF